MFDLFSLHLFLLFFLKTMKSYKDICSAWISRTSAEIFFLIDWHHKRLKNAIDLVLFYGEHFYGFSAGLVKNGKRVFSKTRGKFVSWHETYFSALWLVIWAKYNPTACSPLASLNSHTRKKKYVVLFTLGKFLLDFYNYFWFFLKFVSTLSDSMFVFFFY